MAAPASTSTPYPAGAPQDHHTGVVSLIVDTDMGLDDARAILALLSDTRVDVHAFIVTEGSASIGKGADNLIGLLESTNNEHIPVYKGHTHRELEPPPWRETADNMGGVPFPPPRTATAPSGSLNIVCTLLENLGGMLVYLSLGPLSNLAWFARECPGSLEAADEIWIPVTIANNGKATGWNLRYDSKSTEIVMREVPNIVFVDLSGVLDIDAGAVFSAINETSTAAHWIKDSKATGAHLFLYDELAAVAAVNRATCEFREKSYKVKPKKDGTLELEPSKQGTITVAELHDMKQSTELLVDLWETPQRETTMAKKEETIPPETLIKTFHGHLGPYVVLGYRMGRHALDITDSEGHFDVSVEVYSVLKPPRSCLIDGVQLGSGCTLGKRNIEVHEFSGVPYSVFTTETGETVTIRLRSEIPDLISRLIDSVGVETAGEKLMEKNIESLFVIEKGLAK